jgi:hypothetical protein
MLLIIGLIALVGVSSGLAGFWFGRVRAENQLVTKMKTDPKFGQTLLEYLASLWGAKLELFSPLTDSPGPTPPPPKG